MDMKPRGRLADTSFKIGACLIVPASHSIDRNGETIRVEPKTIDLLLCLAENAGEVVRREAIEAELWPDVVVGYDALTQAVTKLRKALGDDGRNPHIIETVSKSGYRLLESVQPCAIDANTESIPPEATGDSSRQSQKFTVRKNVIRGLLLVSAIATILITLQTGFQEDPSETTGDVTGERPRVMVLPLTNLGGHADQAYFGEGLTEELITRLSQDPRFFVLGRSTSFAYKNNLDTPRDLLLELKVDYLLEGSVERIGEKVRINARLVESDSGNTLWGELLEGPFEDLFAMRDRFIERVGETIGDTWGVIKMNEIERAEHRDPVSVHAYDWYLKAHASYYLFSREGNAKARELAEQGLREFPQSTLLHAKVAWTHYIEGAFGWSTDREKSMRTALNSAELALQQPNASTLGKMHAHWASGKLYMWLERDIDRSLASYEKALQLDPYSADLMASTVEVLSWAGRSEEALARGRMAIERNPSGPIWYHLWYGFAHFVAGRYEEAIRILTAVNKPGWTHRARWLAASLAAVGRVEEARAQITTLLKNDPDESQSRLRKTLPYKDAQYLERELAYLKIAGLPE